MDIKINDFSVKLEVAGNFFTRTRGLMFRDPLKEDEGMLFLFPTERKHGFWNLNVSFDIDIVWLDSQMNVVDVAQGVKAGSLKVVKPKGKSLYAIELKSGMSEKFQIKQGQRINLNLQA